MIRFFTACLLAVVLAPEARLFASPGPPLAPGEQLRYSVSWAIVPGAGEIDVSAQPAGPDKLKVTTKTSTRRLARLLLPFDATSEAIYDVASGQMLSLREKSQTRGKRAEHLVTFDYAHRQAEYFAAGATAPRWLPIPDGSPSDLISALLETRRWNLKPGDSHDALVLFDDEFYLLTIHALRYETLDTALGTFRTLVLEPRMEKMAPKGMFKKGSTVRVWVTQDEQRLPVKFQVEFNIGTGTARLVSYTPPTPATPPRPPVIITQPMGDAAAIPPGAKPVSAAAPPASVP